MGYGGDGTVAYDVVLLGTGGTGGGLVTRGTRGVVGYCKVSLGSVKYC